MPGARINQDIRHAIGLDLDCRTGRLVKSIGREYRVFDEAPARVGDVPGVNTSAFFGVRVDRKVGVGCSGNALENETVDVPSDRIDADTRIAGVGDGEPGPGQWARHRIDANADAARITDCPTPEPPAACVVEEDGLR